MKVSILFGSYDMIRELAIVPPRKAKAVVASNTEIEYKVGDSFVRYYGQFKTKKGGKGEIDEKRSFITGYSHGVYNVGESNLTATSFNLKVAQYNRLAKKGSTALVSALLSGDDEITGIRENTAIAAPSTLAGFGGNDTLISFYLPNTLVGGEGADTFYIYTRDSYSSPPTIRDFSPASGDKIILHIQGGVTPTGIEAIQTANGTSITLFHTFDRGGQQIQFERRTIHLEGFQVDSPLQVGQIPWLSFA
jgi:Ca2+-binding RTX toxin-like protein